MDKDQRLFAEQNFARSLSQLEDLLEGEPANTSASEPQNGLENDLFESIEPATAADAKPNRFGGSLTDSIPLADRLGKKLSQASEQIHRRADPAAPINRP